MRSCMGRMGWALLALAAGCGGSSTSPGVTPTGTDGGTDAGPATAEFRLGGTYDVALRWTAGSGSCMAAMESETDEVVVQATTVILRRGSGNYPDACALYLQRQGSDTDGGAGALQLHATGMVGTCRFHFGTPSDATAPEAVLQLTSADVVLRRNADNTRTASMHFTWAVPMGTSVCGNGGQGGMLVETTDTGG